LLSVVIIRREQNEISVRERAFRRRKVKEKKEN